MKRFLNPLLVTLAAGTLIACSSSSSDGGGGPGPSDEAFKVSATGTPFDEASAVVIEFTGIEIKPQDGDSIVFDFDEPKRIDLLALQGSESSALLEDADLEPGNYAFLQLQVNAEPGVLDSFIEFVDGSQHPLFIPSGAEQGLRLVSGFTITQGSEADFTIDIDLRKSIHSPPGQDGDYFLRPALRLVDNNESGSLAGNVDELIATSEPCFDAAGGITFAAVYIYEGVASTPGDVCVSEGATDCPEDVDRPLGTTLVTVSDDDQTLFSYEIGFLAEGEYTAALTCDVRQDNPESDDRDSVQFESPTQFSIIAGEETRVDFGDVGNGGETGENEEAADNGGADDDDALPELEPGDEPEEADDEEGAFDDGPGTGPGPLQ